MLVTGHITQNLEAFHYGSLTQFVVMFDEFPELSTK